MSIDIKSVLKNSLFRGGAIFFIGGIIANVLNYVYRIVMGRMLGPEAFGELIAIISLVLILVVPSASIQAVAARFSAVLETQKLSRKLKNLFGYLTRVFSLISLVLIIGAVVFAGEIQNFLNLSSQNYVYYLVGIVVVMLIAGVTKGILQGLKRFSKLSYAIMLEAALKVGLAVGLVALGFKMTGALAGFLIPLILVYFLTFYFLRDILSQRGNNEEIAIEQKKEIWQYVFYSFLVFFFLNILLNVDIILVKHYFPALEAGIYSGFATLGRAVFIAFILLAGILFPIVAFKQAKKEDYFHPLKIISLISFLIGGVGISIFFLFPKELLLLFFGNNYLAGAPFLGYYGLIMGILGFIFLLSYFFMALNKFKFLYILAAGSILEIVLISLWHSNFSQVISMFSIALIFTLSALLGVLYFSSKFK